MTEQQETRDIYVRNPFTLTRQDGERVNYAAGHHKNVPLFDAEHWLTKAHLQPEGEDPKTADDPVAVSERDRNARLVAEEEVARLQVLLRNGETARTALTADRDEARAKLAEYGDSDPTSTAADKTRIAELEAEVADLKAQLDADDAATDTTSDASAVGVRRKGRRWFVHRGSETLAEFGSKEAADAHAATLRAPPATAESAGA